MTTLADLTDLGLRWDAYGQSGLSGPLLRLADDLDLALRRLAGSWDAVEEQPPATLPAADLTSHLRAFPHQATFTMGLEPGDVNLGEFADGPVVDPAGSVVLTRTGPVTTVLTPAACFHVYAQRRGVQLAEAAYVTTRSTCFRREERYEPLQRQWSFAMREIVCLGTSAEAASFLTDTRTLADDFSRLVDLPLDWSPATDPFFRPHLQPGFLMQRVQLVKHEAAYGALALASANRHHSHFGSTFGISRDGVPASTACVAFGLERWLYALVDRHGTDPGSWPDLVAAAEQAVAR
ncbi:hypothetical protein HDA40_000577 [Hamadaea flava]|uniref:Aminoacyl-transfer RNA synthetases class-II family profile domain-containing protein n=1 Tax=Hamadaea flava TaxID=1742688 RepID=A0ABV8LYS7_9ACTN|nr:hypothetical protein [Hamadaea flava]MCP2322070.1 hypothetical protein [Hamadaea flava]